ncbi:MAG: hypothetical protein QCI38_01175 [Candidatus Thermoplasmatota archaeon]|nr:hypothetical protein [Candidatus Thermoplasmatota archaeon]
MKERAKKSNEAQMLIFDALVFFVIMLAAAMVPAVIDSGHGEAAEMRNYGWLQTQADSSLQTLLHSTIPPTQYPSAPGGGYSRVENLEIGLGLQMEIENLALGDPRSRYVQFENEVNETLKAIMPPGIRGAITVEMGETSIRIGAAMGKEKTVASSQQQFKGSGISIRFDAWPS